MYIQFKTMVTALLAILLLSPLPSSHAGDILNDILFYATTANSNAWVAKNNAADAYLLTRYWRRHRTAAIGLVATTVALAAGVTAATVGFVQARESERNALAQARNASAISSVLLGLFEEANPNNSAGQERTVRQVLDVGVQLLLRALEAHRLGAPGDTVGESRILNDIGDLLRIQSRHDEAARYIQQALDIDRAHGHTHSDDHADALNNLSLVYQEAGRLQEARAAMIQALQMRQDLFDAPHPKIALSLHNLAWHHEQSGQLHVAERYAREGAEMRVEVFGEIHPRVASTVGLLSRVYLAQGKWAEAEAAARRAVTISEQIFASGHPDLTFPLYQLASVLYAQGELREARDRFARIVEWERVSLGAKSHDLGMSMLSHAATLVDLADYAHAESLLQEALNIFLPLPAGSALALYRTRTQLGRVYVHSGEPDEAARHLLADHTMPSATVMPDDALVDRRLAIVEYHLSQDAPGSAAALFKHARDEPAQDDARAQRRHAQWLLWQGRVQAANQQHEASLQTLEQALAAFRTHYGAGHWRTAYAQSVLAHACAAAGQHARAQALIADALPVLRRVLGDRHPETIRAVEVHATTVVAG